MLISVNVVKTYPVSWNRYKIFRDFIQNFYDSVGFKNFAKSFQYKFNKNKSVLEIFVNNVTFSYEWLLHIGASTKTQNSNDNAGYFGEGFKIASLCAIRDYFYTVTMESGKWKLKVLFVESIIDHQKIEMLSYDLVKLKKEKNISKLTLGNIKEDDYDTFLYTIQSFYFPENPIFGEKIWEDKTGGLYYRSKNEIDERLPYTDKFSRKGAVFCNFQMLGTHPFPFVICNNKARIKDRERKSLYRFDVIDIFEEMANSIPSSAAMTVLEFMRKYWYCVNHKRTDIYSWKPVIDILVYNISKSKEITEAFKAKYPNIVCLNTVHFYDEINRRRAAKEWYKNRSEEKFIFANESFGKLGYPTLESVCAKNNGFSNDEYLNPFEKECFSILYSATNKIFGNFFSSQTEPVFKILTNDNCIYAGKVKLLRSRKKEQNRCGFKIRYCIDTLYLKRSILRDNNFYDCFSTFVHEMCHIFGGDASDTFSLALTSAMTIIMENQVQLEETHTQWHAVFSKNAL